MENKAIKKSIKDKNELAKAYKVPVSAIVWIGNNHYIIIKNGSEIRV